MSGIHECGKARLLLSIRKRLLIDSEDTAPSVLSWEKKREALLALTTNQSVLLHDTCRLDPSFVLIGRTSWIVDVIELSTVEFRKRANFMGKWPEESSGKTTQFLMIVWNPNFGFQNVDPRPAVRERQILAGSSQLRGRASMV